MVFYFVQLAHVKEPPLSEGTNFVVVKRHNPLMISIPKKVKIRPKIIFFRFWYHVEKNNQRNNIWLS